MSSIRRSRSTATRVAAGFTLCFAGALLAGCSTTAGSDVSDVETEPSVAPEAPVTESDGTEATTDATAGQEVPVIINSALLDTDAGTIEVRGTVTQVIGEGTCTATAVNPAGEELTAELEATPDAKSTICSPIIIEGVTGTEWTVTLSIQGDGFTGTSEPLAVEVG